MSKITRVIMYWRISGHWYTLSPNYSYISHLSSWRKYLRHHFLVVRHERFVVFEPEVVDGNVAFAFSIAVRVLRPPPIRTPVARFQKSNCVAFSKRKLALVFRLEMELGDAVFAAIRTVWPMPEEKLTNVVFVRRRRRRCARHRFDPWRKSNGKCIKKRCPNSRLLAAAASRVAFSGCETTVLSFPSAA